MKLAGCLWYVHVWTILGLHTYDTYWYCDLLFYHVHFEHFYKNTEEIIASAFVTRLALAITASPCARFQQSDLGIRCFNVNSAGLKETQRA